MNTTKKGDILEAIVCVLEKSQQTNPDTKTYTKHKILDRHGKMREHDIYVETLVNKKLIKYSFECKAFGSKTKVQMSHIAEFYDKLQETGINGIFVSNGHFQKNALEKAKKLSIEVYAIREGNPANKPITSLKLMRKDFNIGTLVFHITKKHAKLFENKHAVADFIYHGSGKVAMPINDFVNYLRHQVAVKVRENYATLFSSFISYGPNNSIIITGGTVKRVEGNIHLEKYFYKIGDGYFPLENVGYEVFLSHDLQNVDTSQHNSFINLHTGEEIADFFTVKSKFHGEDVLMNFIKTKDSELKFAAVNPSQMNAQTIKFEESIKLMKIQEIKP